MQPLIVNIHAHNPPYAFASDHDRPDVAWEKPDGTWLGLWAREWPDLLGEAILRADSGFRWEVWQPDYRADRVYSATLESGQVCGIFFGLTVERSSLAGNSRCAVWQSAHIAVTSNPLWI